MRGIIAAVVALGVVYVTDIFLNDGRYGDVVANGLLALVGK